MSPIQYAVSLGANTPRRLAREWDTPLTSAYTALKHAATRGELRRVSDGVHAPAWNFSLRDES